MELNSDKMTGLLCFPVKEAEKIIEAMKQAEAAADLKALQWCVRQFLWLTDNAADHSTGDDELYPAHIFNRDWDKQLKADPPPESVKGIIQDEPEGDDVV